MNQKEKVELLTMLENIQRNTASITLSIGGTTEDGFVLHDTIEIIDAPPKVIEELSKTGYMIGVGKGGVTIDMAPHKKKAGD